MGASALSVCPGRLRRAHDDAARGTAENIVRAAGIFDEEPRSSPKGLVTEKRQPRHWNHIRHWKPPPWESLPDANTARRLEPRPDDLGAACLPQGQEMAAAVPHDHTFMSGVDADTVASVKDDIGAVGIGDRGNTGQRFDIGGVGEDGSRQLPPF
ncbi:MAG: hypothetical protein U5L46_01200 [Agrobacterium sp.]|nr:hypothetical protein [Agrobacterium sp.]